MAHNLATIDGKVAMAYQGSTPWHELGTVMPSGLVDVGAALTAASLDWTVGLERMFLANRIAVPRKYAIVRDIDSAVVGIASDWYKPIQYRDAFAVFQPAVEQFGLTVESAGALGDGEKAWMLFRLPSTVSPVPGDDINGYGVAVTGHDGKTAFEFRPTPIRVVCQNTLNAAVETNAFGRSSAKGRMFAISHIGSDIDSQIAAAKEMVVGALDAMQATGETFASMAHKKLTPKQVVDFIERVFPDGEDGKVTTQLADRRKAVSELIWTGVGAELAMSETDGEPNPWACYNAVTEYFDHVAPAKTAKASRRANQSALFGTGAELKLLALKAARELVAA